MKKLFALFLALFCAQLVMAQDFGPVKKSKDVLGKWEGVAGVDEEQTKAMLGELPPEYSDLKFTMEVKLTMVFKAVKENVEVTTSMMQVFYIENPNPLPPEFIEAIAMSFGEHGFTTVANKTKTQLVISATVLDETEVATKQEFEMFCENVMISKNKKTILLVLDGNEMQLNKK